ncbi:hypothetical protein GCM10009716_13370 [Streptomyces sodiiphilus]|uniref:Uncharacterized protein n=1 Tax=Streptomyces sodiiphilus TaxID=226217 RepID=A0ABN2NXV6_9ACTN
MARTVIDLDGEMAAQPKGFHGRKTEAAAVRTAMEDDVKRRLRQQFIDAVKSEELDFSEIVDKTKVPDSAKGPKAT